MADEGFKGFGEAGMCENFFEITPTPDGAPTQAGVTTLFQEMHELPTTFNCAQTSTEDTAVILYTSGTTGTPKGAELTHSNIAFNVITAKDLINGTSDDTHLVTLPLFHSFGQVVQMNMCFYTGATQILIPRFDPELVLRTMLEKSVTVFAGVPTMYWAMLQTIEKTQMDITSICKNLRLGVCGGASLPLAVLQNFEEKFKLPILEGYGLSETSPVASFNHLHGTRKPGSIGTPVWGVEMDVKREDGTSCSADEVGEIAIRGHNVMKGYFKKPEATAAVMKDGWFMSGDLAKKDDEGYYFIVDRLKDMVIRGGFNVYPREIEEKLMLHDKVSMAAVIGVPDDENGEEIKAYVIPKQGMTINEAELMSWAKENMAAYKYPRIIEVRDTLPMTATGKILKKELKRETA